MLYSVTLTTSAMLIKCGLKSADLAHSGHGARGVCLRVT